MANNDDPAATLKKGIASALDSGEYSDLTITCQGKVFAAHKVVVCTQSRFFRNACKKDTFKESETGNIDLSHDDPAAVEAMYRYFYTFEYSPLAAEDNPESLLLHVRVYCLAHKYEIDALNSAVAALFQTTSMSNFSVDTFTPVIKEIYENTEDGDDLRGMAVVAAIANKQSLFHGGRSDFANMMAEVGEFGRDVFSAISTTAPVTGSNRGLVTFHCSRSGCDFFRIDLSKVSSSFERSAPCPNCQSKLEISIGEGELSRVVFHDYKCEICGNVFGTNIKGLSYPFLCPTCGENTHCRQI